MNAFWHRMWGPRTRTLPNGKTISKKRSLTWLYLILVVLAFYYSIELTGFKMSTLLKRGNQFFVILGRMYPPNWDYWASVQGPLLDTIKMSILDCFLQHGCQPLGNRLYEISPKFDSNSANLDLCQCFNPDLWDRDLCRDGGYCHLHLLLYG